MLCISTKIKCSLKMCMWLQVNGHQPVENMMKKVCILVPLLLLLPPVKLRDLRAQTFIYYDTAKSWADAQAVCRENHTDLITIRDATENLDFFHGWLGLYRDDSTSDWKWSRGDEKANFTTWKDGMSRHCVKWATPLYLGNHRQKVFFILLTLCWTDLDDHKILIFLPLI